VDASVSRFIAARRRSAEASSLPRPTFARTSAARRGRSCGEDHDLVHERAHLALDRVRPDGGLNRGIELRGPAAP